MTPAESLKKLADGNERFVSGLRSIEPMMSHLRLEELAKNGQKPHAIILTCSDSRSPAEMLFDAGIGELFVVRVAGNVVAPSLLASIEFAAANFGCSLIVVLGHTLCGAIKATVEHSLNPSVKLPSSHLEELIGRIKPAVSKCSANHTGPQLITAATHENIRQSCDQIIEQSKIIRSLVQDGEIAVVGGLLDISNGQVEFQLDHRIRELESSGVTGVSTRA